MQPSRGQPLEPRLRVLALPDLASDTRSAARRARSGSRRRSRPPGAPPPRGRRRAAASRPRGAGAARRWRSAARPIASMRRPSRMQVSTSTSRRRLRVVHDRLGGGDERQPERGGQPRGPGDAGAVLPVVARARRRDAPAGARAAKARARGSHGAQVARPAGGCSSRCEAPRPVRSSRWSRQLALPGRARAPSVSSRQSRPQPARSRGSAVTSSPSARQSRAAGRSRGTAAPARAASLSSWWARTRPATELRSAMAKAGRPSSVARSAYSCGWLPPVRKLKFEVIAELGEGHRCGDRRGQTPARPVGAGVCTPAGQASGGNFVSGAWWHTGQPRTGDCRAGTPVALAR